MGYRFLIIDNRQERAKSLIGDQWDDLSTLPNVTILDSLPEQQRIEEFDVIGVHGSIIKEKDKNDLLNQLVAKKYVIVFSGAESQVVLLNNAHLLKMPAISFYSHKLIPFCNYLDSIENQQIQLLALIYGLEHCRLPILLQLRQLLWQFPENHRRYAERQKIESLKSTLGITDVGVLDEEIRKELMSL